MALLWKARYFESLRELANANRGIHRLRAKYDCLLKRLKRIK